MVGLRISSLYPGIVVALCVAARLTTASIISTPSPSPSISDSFTSISSSTLVSSTTPDTLSSLAFTSIVAGTHGLPPGHDYALNPFGILSGDAGGGGGGDEDQDQDGNGNGGGAAGAQPKQTQMTENKLSSAVPGEASKTIDGGKLTGVSATSRASISSASNAYSAATTTVADASTTQTSGPASIQLSSTTTSPSANANAGSSGSSMNSWKIIGIGVLAFAGIVGLVLGFVFHDALLRPLRNCAGRRAGWRGMRDEQLVPDWNRRSWSFGGDGNGLDMEKKKVSEDGGPRICTTEKGNMQFPLPPVSPFPIRRAPSAKSNKGTSANANTDSSTAHVKSDGYSIIPSPPPPMHAPQPTRPVPGATSLQTSHSQTQPERPNALGSGYLNSDSDAYGGIEEVGSYAARME